MSDDGPLETRDDRGEEKTPLEDASLEGDARAPGDTPRLERVSTDLELPALPGHYASIGSVTQQQYGKERRMRESGHFSDLDAGYLGRNMRQLANRLSRRPKR